MSKEEDYDDLYEDEVDGVLDLDAPNAEEEEEADKGEAFGVEMFGPTGRGSPAMGHQSPYQLSRNAAASLRRVGFEDETHLKDTTAWEPQAQPRQKPKVVVRAAAVMVKAKPPQKPPQKPRPPQEYRNQFSDNDEKAQEEADKFWLSMGHLPLRHRVGEEYEKLMQERTRPQRNKGGTRKRNTRRSIRKRRAYKKRSMRKHMRKHATRRR